VIKLALALAAGLTLPALALLNYSPGQPAASGRDALQWAYAGLPSLLKCIAIIWLSRISAHAFSRKASS